MPTPSQLTLPSFAPTEAPERSRLGSSDRIKTPAAKRSRRTPWAWLRSLMQRRLRLERRGLQVHLRLVEQSDIDSVSASEGGRGSALRRDHEQLTAVLDSRPELRLTLRSLVYIEQALARRGSRALKGEPPKLLAKVLKQLERLQLVEPGWQFPELERRLRDSSRAKPDDDSDFDVAVQVSEASHSLFDEMERSWSGVIPASSGGTSH